MNNFYTTNYLHFSENVISSNQKVLHSVCCVLVFKLMMYNSDYIIFIGKNKFSLT